MTQTIILNVKTPVKLRDVAVIEPVTQKDIAALAKTTGLPESRFGVFQSNIRFVNGSNMLTTQSFDDISALANHRFIAVRTVRDQKGASKVTQIVPIDAIRHLEFINRADRENIKKRYAETDPAKIDILKTRIIYLGLDPDSIKAGRANYLQKMVPADIKTDLRGTQKLDIIGIGHGKFLLSSEIAAAKNLDENELKSLARKYNFRSAEDGDLKTSITLRSGDLIMSVFSAEEIGKKVKRVLPSTNVNVNTQIGMLASNP